MMGKDGYMVNGNTLTNLNGYELSAGEAADLFGPLPLNGSVAGGELEGSGCSTSCRCDYYGTTVATFTCKTCYNGIVQTSFVNPNSHEEETGTSESQKSVGHCYGSTTKACAQEFVDEHPAGSEFVCWFDPSTNEIVFERGWTEWVWITIISVAILTCCFCELACHCWRAICCCCCCGRKSSEAAPMMVDAPMAPVVGVSSYGGQGYTPVVDAVEMTPVEKK